MCLREEKIQEFLTEFVKNYWFKGLYPGNDFSLFFLIQDIGIQEFTDINILYCTKNALVHCHI